MKDQSKRESVVVTPDIARHWLETLADYQRKASSKDVDLYARMMKEGKWDENVPQAICFDTDGRLCDGQHRLMAVVASGASIKFDVIRGMTRETFLRLDQGRRRTAAEFINVKYSAHISALISRIIAIKSHATFSSLCMKTATRDKVLREDIVAEYQKNPMYYTQLVEKARKLYRNVRIASPSTIAFAIWSEQLLDNDDLLDSFIREACDVETAERCVLYMRQLINTRKLDAPDSQKVNKWGVGVFLKSYELYKRGEYTKRMSGISQFLDKYDARVNEALEKEYGGKQ